MLECAEASGVATNTIMKIEKMETVPISQTNLKERGMVPPSVVEKLLHAFESAGLRLVPGTETRPARVERITTVKSR